MITNSLVGYIKHLDKEGFTNKQICMITKCKQPYITKILAGTIRSDVAENWTSDSLDNELKLRYEALFFLLTNNEIIIFDNSFETSQYIKLLKFIGRDIKETKDTLFPHLSNNTFLMLRTFSSTKVEDFNIEHYFPHITNFTLKDLLDF